MTSNLERWRWRWGALAIHIVNLAPAVFALPMGWRLPDEPREWAGLFVCVAWLAALVAFARNEWRSAHLYLAADVGTIVLLGSDVYDLTRNGRSVEQSLHGGAPFLYLVWLVALISLTVAASWVASLRNYRATGRDDHANAPRGR